MSLAQSLLALRPRLLHLSDRLAFLAPLLIRLTVGLVFATTGWGKLGNLENTESFFRDLGIPMPGFNAVLVASTELLGGLFLLVGLGARLVALPLAFTMVIAILTAQREALDGVVALAGFEEWSYLVMFLVIAIAGPGALSVDAWLARRFERAQGAVPAAEQTHRAPAPGLG